jgi:uncharacterized membrane protein YccF (DUF307 family)
VRYTSRQPAVYNRALSLVLNILWFVLGGFLVVFAYVFGGLLLCITIIGIPLAFFTITII